MGKFCLRAFLVAGLCILGAALGSAEDWTTTESYPKVDLSGLSATQKATVLKLIRARGCPCGCGMKVAECRVKDPNCYYSRGIASVIVTAIAAGKSESVALAEAEASPFAHMPERKVLEAAVNIPVAGAPVIGPKDAPVTIVEFSDFQCPYCRLATPELHEILKAYPTQVKLIFKQFPLDFHSQAAMAAAAAIAAHKQGKFWQMHDALFSSRADLSAQSIRAVASALGLDMKRFEADWTSEEVKKVVERDQDDGMKIGVMGTPTLFIDGQHYNGNIKLDVLKPILEAELKHPATVAKPVAAAPASTR